MGIKSVLGKVGHVFSGLWGFLKHAVPDEQLIAAVEYCEKAAEKFVDNSQRREWVVGQLRGRFHISESIARLLVELAIQQVKNKLDEGAGKLEADVQDSK